VEEAVVGHALDLLRRLSLAAIVLGDRGVGRKEFLIRLAQQEQAAVLRVDPDITVYLSAAAAGLLLADALAQQPWRGMVNWDRGEHGRLRCRLRTLRATIRFSRTGRKDDVQEATINVVEAVPVQGPTESLVLATTLPVETVAQARAIVRLYAQRWAIETSFETMHAWGQDRFMVRSWSAIDRLLWALAVAYAVVVLALYSRPLRRFRAQACAVLTQLSVVGDRLTPGKLAEAIGLDYARHARAWLSVWLT
jgi:Transposase DDE domain